MVAINRVSVSSWDMLVRLGGMPISSADHRLAPSVHAPATNNHGKGIGGCEVRHLPQRYFRIQQRPTPARASDLGRERRRIGRQCKRRSSRTWAPRDRRATAGRYLVDRVGAGAWALSLLWHGGLPSDV